MRGSFRVVLVPGVRAVLVVEVVLVVVAVLAG